ncbi:CPBP family intramembrane glutamic endopeptidase [Corynebacterium lubricantis]|uniref:CPBP family intramembrane glutamic endopeptidase n=1 Tax=Corynebacterium lubricantis TaxID=541095 RepID=UPI0014615507|nr:CPBP family intramembrane glutamic endopeptidase [Corynebacterium lubricantis]
MKSNELSSSQPVLSTRWWGILIRLAVALAVLSGSNYARLPLHAWAESHFSGDAEIVATSVIFLLTPAVIVLGVWVWMRWIERRPIRVLRMLDARAAASGLAGGILIIGIVMVASWAMLAGVSPAETAVSGEELTGPGGDLNNASITALVFFLISRSFLLQGIPEELLYRGWLFDVLRHRPWTAFGWTTVGFVAAHLFSSGGQQSVAEHIYYLIVPLGMSVLGAALVLWRGHFWWAAGTHGGFHFWLAICSVIYPVELGPRVWIVTGLAQMMAGVVIVCVCARRGHFATTRSAKERFLKMGADL